MRGGKMAWAGEGKLAVRQLALLRCARQSPAPAGQACLISAGKRRRRLEQPGHQHQLAVGLLV